MAVWNLYPDRYMYLNVCVDEYIAARRKVHTHTHEKTNKHGTILNFPFETEQRREAGFIFRFPAGAAAARPPGAQQLGSRWPLGRTRAAGQRHLHTESLSEREESLSLPSPVLQEVEVSTDPPALQNAIYE